MSSGEKTVFVHELGLCESDCVGSGTRIWAFAHVMPGAEVGADCNVGDHAFVEGGARLGDRVTVKNGVQIYDGVTVEDDVFLGPNMIFTNDRVPRSAPEFKSAPQDFLPTRVRRGASIGANATIVCGVEIGEWALVGAGAVVTGNVQAHALVVGNPARRIGWVCSCGERLDENHVCSCGRCYRESDPGAGLVSSSRAGC